MAKNYEKENELPLKTIGTSHIFIFLSQEKKNPTAEFEKTMIFNEVTNSSKYVIYHVN